MRRFMMIVLGGCFFVLLAGCQDESSSPTMLQQVVSIERGDECHLCGMLIMKFPGPKGELYIKRDPSIKKFCSTRDLLSFYLQPENKTQIDKMYVHDMAVTPWDHPDDEVFIDARTAWYVIGGHKKGAMGPTLASFSLKQQAEQFAGQGGGKVTPFSGVTQSLLNELNLEKVQPHKMPLHHN